MIVVSTINIFIIIAVIVITIIIVIIIDKVILIRKKMKDGVSVRYSIYSISVVTYDDFVVSWLGSLIS